MERTLRWDADAVLAQASFFRDLSEANRRALAGIAIARAVPRGTVLFHEGTPGHSIYLLHRGAIRLHKRSAEAGDVVIKLIRPGEIFAEIVLFESSRYPVTATAAADATVFLFPRQGFRALLRREDFLDDFLGMLIRKQRYLADQIVRLRGDTVETRLSRFLDDHLGPDGSGEIAAAKKDVAAAIGTTPETLSRLLRRLADTGQLTWRGRAVHRGPAAEALSRRPPSRQPGAGAAAEAPRSKPRSPPR